jgi:haloacetate dehalogenase
MLQTTAEPIDSRTTRRQFLGASLGAVIGSAALPGAALDAAASSGSTAVARPPTANFFPGFDPIRIETSATTINGVRGGSGPPLLLLHGYPQSHLEWTRVAPMLAEHFTVVATDLRGYGDSGKPPDGENHSGYSKREMARDQVEVMEQLGFSRFALVGHDRGGRVAHRLALDHTERVSRLAVLDIVPTRHVYSTVDKELATAYYHWFFLIQPAPLPETLIGSNADFVLRRSYFGRLIPEIITDEIYAEYLRCYSDPATLHAMCEDYRAAAGIDLEHDEADIDRRIECPTLALWGANGAMHRLYDVLDTWRDRAVDVTGHAVAGGHWLPEERPQEIFDALMEFVSA